MPGIVGDLHDQGVNHLLTRPTIRQCFRRQLVIIARRPSLRRWTPRGSTTPDTEPVSYLKLVKLKGEFVWHQHEDEDELFLVVKGALTIKLRDRDLSLAEGEFVVIPRGVEHCPVAAEEVQVILLEPKSTLQTGNVVSERAVAEQQRI